MISRLAVLLVLLSSLAPFALGREVVDMMGRKVTVPDKIERLYAPSPYGAYMMYAIAPELMTGLVFAPKENEKKFLPKHLWDLPVIGGGPRAANPESLAKTNPQLLIMWKNDRNPLEDRASAQMDKLGIPYVYVVADGMTGYPAAIRFLGKLTGREKRAEAMAKLVEKILADVQAAVQKTPAVKRPRVYYAEGVDGLSTECNDSIHTQVLLLAGDVDVHRCHTSSHMGMEKVSLEQILVEAPDVIFAQDKLFYDKVYRDPAWQLVKPVKERRVYLIPRTPLNWFDRPPSFMRFLGLQWVASQLYPAAYPVDMKKEVKQFYKTFLDVTLSDQDVQDILQQK
jgi:iron complex transport system substrate-binding protein